ncbi:hypothetical protein AVEN_32859-1 [Araneus ventricosus]|uniref:Uncharacterized protein n=1 Tax=Araneus ventricosus TaxID=182803 RepID=A0A4Y2DYB3_ARAVE|nr:hypothetical protein AVEN_32859-1 [Araneus ventricosus]
MLLREIVDSHATRYSRHATNNRLDFKVLEHLSCTPGLSVFIEALQVALRWYHFSTERDVSWVKRPTKLLLSRNVEDPWTKSNAKTGDSVDN